MHAPSMYPACAHVCMHACVYVEVCEYVHSTIFETFSTWGRREHTGTTGMQGKRLKEERREKRETARNKRTIYVCTGELDLHRLSVEVLVPASKSVRRGPGNKLS